MHRADRVLGVYPSCNQRATPIQVKNMKHLSGLFLHCSRWRLVLIVVLDVILLVDVTVPERVWHEENGRNESGHIATSDLPP